MWAVIVAVFKESNLKLIGGKLGNFVTGQQEIAPNLKCTLSEMVEKVATGNLVRFLSGSHTIACARCTYSQPDFCVEELADFPSIRKTMDPVGPLLAKELTTTLCITFRSQKCFTQRGWGPTRRRRPLTKLK